MLDDLNRSIKEAVSDSEISGNASTKGLFENAAHRFKGRLVYSIIFGLVFLGVAAFIILMIVFFVLKSL